MSMNNRMDYESALRFVFKCNRGGGPEGLAEADTFSSANSTSNWAEVAKGLKLALQEIKNESAQVEWYEEESISGGLKPNFEINIDSVIKMLGNKTEYNNIDEIYGALSNLITAISAITRKNIS